MTGQHWLRGCARCGRSCTRWIGEGLGGFVQHRCGGITGPGYLQGFTSEAQRHGEVFENMPYIRIGLKGDAAGSRSPEHGFARRPQCQACCRVVHALRMTETRGAKNAAQEDAKGIRWL